MSDIERSRIASNKGEGYIMRTSVFCRHLPEAFPRPFWIVGVKPFGIHETAIETKVHYDQRSAADDYGNRVGQARV